MRLDILIKENREVLEKFSNDEVELPWDLYTELYEIFYHEMPYGTAKARTGDPYVWVCERLLLELGEKL